MERIYCSGPSITDKEIAYVTDAVTRCWYGDAGLYHQRFERAAADYVGLKHAVSTPTGTSAIHLALWAMGVGPGDEVIVPEITWIGSAAPIKYLGAEPVFADIDPATLCVSAASVEACITPRTKALIAVDLYSNLPDYRGLQALADRHSFTILEDAAQAWGTEAQGRKAGSFGHVSIFSLHGSKTLTCGEGGLMLTDDDALWQRALSLRDHGRRPGGERFVEDYDNVYYHYELGNKFKMTSMQAALALAQIERASELVALKRRIHDWYVEELADFAAGSLLAAPADQESAYWLPTLIFNADLGFDKHAVIRAMDQENIDIRPVHYPLSWLLPFRDTPAGKAAAQSNREAYRLSPLGINLPSCLNMRRDQVARVRDALRRVVERCALERTVATAT